MKYRVIHNTQYLSADPVSVGHNEAWLTPRTTATQQVLSQRIVISPEPSVRSTLVDYFGNTVTQFVFNQGYDSLSVSATDEVEITASPRTDLTSPAWEQVLSNLRSHVSPAELEAYEFTFDSPRCRSATEFAGYARESFTPQRPILEAAADLMHRFYREFRYDSTTTTVSTPVEQVFRLKSGVCQDFSHMMISMIRSLGLSARYVSGYLRTTPPPGKPRLVGADASHAWLGVYCGPLGWVDLDPTNDVFPALDHITLAWGRDYSDVAPVKGVYVGGSSPQLQVNVDVCPVG
ncbi:MAG: transglutaminase family protein [Planctomycetaceae bacterium]